MRIQGNICKCNKCKHEWLPKKDNPDPVTCSKCKSAYWNR